MDEESKMSIVASMATLILSLPALLGTCCWPVLVAGLMGVSSTLAARELSHAISFAVTLAVLTNLIQLFYHKAGLRLGRRRLGPTYILSVASILILADQIRHVLQDTDIWPSPGSNMYLDNCHTTAFSWCLTAVGWVLAIGCTYSGFTLMVLAVVWQTNLVTKVKRAWYGEDCGCEV